MTLCFSAKQQAAVAFSHLQRTTGNRIVDPRNLMRLYLSTETDHDSETDHTHTTVAATTVTTTASSNGTTRKEERYQRARDKRRKFIGMAKAVDRGQWSVTYNPAVPTFQAKSGLPDRTRLFTVLGIESSCDDTGAAVVRSDGTILGEALASQQEIHEAWGGVVPGLARDAHVDKIDSVIEEALANANMSLEDVDAIGVTVGPGLEICLRVGCYKARELAVQHKVPFVGVHHLEAHILMARIGAGVNIPATPETHASERAMDFPFLALLVSGGHCQLMKCHGIGEYTILGGTMDDSLGERPDEKVRASLNMFIVMRDRHSSTNC